MKKNNILYSSLKKIRYQKILKMIKCIVCGKQYLKENEKYHEFQECKGYDGLDPGEETIFALDFFNREEEMLENDEKLAKQLQEEEDKKSINMLKNK